MKKYKVIDILNLANKKYTLYFSKEDKGTQINTYTKRIRKCLKNKGYEKPFNDIKASDVYYIVDYELKDYFIKNSIMPDYLQKDDLLAQEANDREVRMLTQYKNNQNIGYVDAKSQKSLDEVLNSIKDSDYDPIKKLRDVCNSEDVDLWNELDFIEKNLEKFKQNYIFYALLKQNHEHFDQAQYIKDFFERDKYIDDRGMVEVPKYGYSKYNDKLNEPFRNYIKSSEKDKN